ncbi:MAG: transcriptional regulator, partial [Acidimicrobiia bacterium]
MAADAVRRIQLHELMDLGLETPLTLVSAPAGYGKSTLVSHWIESLDHPTAWLSLDVADGDLTVFTRYLIAAIRTIFPDACRETEALIAAPNLPPVSVLGSGLANELDEIDTSFVLTLDDYHRIAP